MRPSMEGRPVDRAAMIEAASRNLRQQMGSRREQANRSRGSFYDGHVDSTEARVSREPAHTGARGAENAQRRIRSAENEHRIIHAQQPAFSREGIPMQPGSALNHYPAEEDTGADDEEEDDSAHFDEPPQEIKRPLSRKKDPSASAAAGLGAFSSPVKMTDAFEQRKARQPIPVESWGPRPPSRQGGLPAKTSGLDGSLLEEGRSPPLQYPTATSSRSRSDAGTSANVAAATWASARHAPVHDPRAGRGIKPRDKNLPEDLGIFGFSTNSAGRAPTNQQLAKALGGIFDHSGPVRVPAARPDTREAAARLDYASQAAFGQAAVARPGTREANARPEAFAASSYGQVAGSWASHVDAAPGASEVNDMNLGDANAPQWPSSPAGSSCGGSPPTRQAARGQVARHSDIVSVEDVDNDVDLALHFNAFRRDATPPRLVVTRSSQQKKDRAGAQRGREDRGRERGKNIPFPSGLDPDFLGLFAS